MTEIYNIKEANQKQILELQQKNLEILLYFDDICKKNNLTYYFCGGCLIGCVRHKGFIPWDDDVDLFMPRKDYELLKDVWKELTDNKRYVYCRTDQFNNYHHAGTSIRDVETTFINHHSKNEDIVHGIGIEIVPIDGAAPTKIKRLIQLYYAFIFAIFNNQRMPDNKGNLAKILVKIMYKLVPSEDARFKIWKKAEKKMSRYSWEDSEYVTELIGSIKGMLIKHPKKDFETAIYLPFENYEFPVMRGYKRYLEVIFGDYMKLPPIEERLPKHNTVYINTKKSYKHFKGIYFMEGNDK